MNQATCPVCNGSGRKPVPADSKWHESIRGYDKETHTLACTNCGGQTMGGNATGKVNTRPDGTPCVHDYAYQNAGRCYHRYTCTRCGDVYCIDSGD